MHDLQTRLATVLAWLEAGEDVVVKSTRATSTEAAAAVKPEVGQSSVYLDRTGKPLQDSTQLKNKSVVFQRPLAEKPLLSQADQDELLEDMRGPY